MDAHLMTETEEVLERQWKIRDLIAEGKLSEALYLVAYDAKYIQWLLYERIQAEKSARALKKLDEINLEEILHHEEGQTVLPHAGEQ